MAIIHTTQAHLPYKHPIHRNCRKAERDVTIDCRDDSENLYEFI